MMQTYPRCKQILPYIVLILATLGMATQAYAQNCTTNCLSIYSIKLTDLGTSIRGTVKLVDEMGTSGGARSAVVHGMWTRPDGSSFVQYALIGTRLRAEFRLVTGAAPGAYTLEVIDVIKAGYAFDPAGGVDPVSSISVGDILNQPPIAVLNSDTTSGTAPLSINFDSAGSYDPDGSPLSYYWNYGDGSSSSLPNPSHTYDVSGSYIVTLRVTDGLGAATSSSATITVTEPAPDPDLGCTNNCISVAEYSLKYITRTDIIKGSVRLKNENGGPVRDVLVNVVWTLPDGSTVSQSKTIGRRYKATFKIPANSPGTYTLTVVGISKAGYVFDPDNSNVQSGTFEMRF